MFNLGAVILWLKENKPLTVILVFAAIVRFVGLDYGLPLWLVGDEPSHIFGALKMMELKTLLPVLHVNEFIGTFHYTPYLSYLYLLPFTVVVGIKFLFFSGTFEQFKNYLIADPSIFFIIARAISAVFGLATIWFVYAAAWQMFQKKKIALLSALFVAFSFLSVSYSHWARHWTAITFFYTLGLSILAHRGLAVSRRYLLIALLIGIGVGVNVQMTIFGVFVLLWFFIFDYQPISRLLRQKWFWQACGLFFLLFAFAFVLWPRGYSYFLKVGDIDSSARSIGNFVHFFWFYIINLIRTEPLLLLFIIIGWLAMCLRERRVAAVFIGFNLIYLTSFYLFFGSVDRFILPLYPFFAVSAGYGLAFVMDKLPTKLLRSVTVFAVCALLIIPIFRFDYLLMKNDTRVQAIHWAESNTSDGDKVAVLSPLMRLPAAAEAIAEQKSIDSQSLRSVDRAELELVDAPIQPRRFNVLNLYDVNNDILFHNLKGYLKENNYQYIIYSPVFAKGKGADFVDSSFGEQAQIFAGSGEVPLPVGHERIPDGFGLGLRELFYSPSLGPEIRIIEIN